MANFKKGLSPKLYKGLSKKRMAKRGGSFKRVILKQGESTVVQFLDPIEEFIEYDNHAFRDVKGWNFAPCGGDGCPLCADEDRDVSKSSYRFCANVYSFEEKKVLILEGPKDLSSRIAARYERNPDSFLKRTFEVSKLATQPVSYDVERGEEESVRTDGMERHDLEKYITDEMTSYFGEGAPSASASDSPSSLDDDGDEEWADDDEAFFDEDEGYSEEDLLDMSPSDLKSAADEVGIKVGKATKSNRKKLIAAVLRKQ